MGISRKNVIGKGNNRLRQISLVCSTNDNVARAAGVPKRLNIEQVSECLLYSENSGASKEGGCCNSLGKRGL